VELVRAGQSMGTRQPPWAFCQSPRKRTVKAGPIKQPASNESWKSWNVSCQAPVSRFVRPETGGCGNEPSYFEMTKGYLRYMSDLYLVTGAK
jgi:hypothetical protein